MDDREYGIDIVLGELFHEETFKLRHMDGWMGPLDEGSTIARGDLTEHEFLQAWVSLQDSKEGAKVLDFPTLRRQAEMT